jgi:hypothetical protein
MSASVLSSSVVPELVRVCGTLGVLALTVLACGAPSPPAGAPPRVGAAALLDDFPRGWRVEDIRNGTAYISDVSSADRQPGMQIVLGARDGGIEMTRMVHAGALAGRRVSVHLQLVLPSSDASSVELALRGERGTEALDYSEIAVARSTASGTLSATVDLAPGVSGLEVKIRVLGGGTVHITALHIATAEYATEVNQLDARQLDNVVAFARAMALARYFHPSDQSAEADWDRVTAAGMRAVLASRTDAELAATLSSTLGPTAPLAVFYAHGQAAPPRSLLRPTGATHLARWVHRGVPRAEFEAYWSVRTGLGSGRVTHPAVAVVSRRVDMQGAAACPSSRLALTVREISATARLTLWARAVDDTSAVHEFEAARPPHARAGEPTTLALPLPPETRQLTFGVKLGGGGARISGVTLQCASKAIATLADSGVWPPLEGADAARFSVSECEEGCLRIEPRSRDSSLSADDVVTAALSPGVSVRLPRAVWTDGTATYPIVPTPRAIDAAGTLNDIGVRLAIVAQVWAVGRYFYPDLSSASDWEVAFRTALKHAAQSTTGEQLHRILREFVVALSDAHAHVSHVAEDRSHALPLKLALRDGRLLVVGVAKGETRVGVGSEVVAVDGVPSSRAVGRWRSLISSSSTGWSDWAAPVWLGIGAKGAARRLDIRTADGAERDIIIPPIARAAPGQPAEVRPDTGDTLAPGILYVNLETLTPEQWHRLQGALFSAKGLVLDVRGYVTRTSYLVLAALAEGPLASPYWTIPTRTSPDDSSVTFGSERWLILPSPRRFSGRVVFLTDGRAASAAETVMSIVAANKLGTIVGERTAGTNGNPATVDVGGGFGLRLTGMRVLNHARMPFHGTGIEPDVVVRPTAAGVLAARDEVLEAGVRVAQE